MTIEAIFSIFLGIGLAASVGFRIFLPLLVVSIAAHLNGIPLNEDWMWMGTSAAIITFGVATLIEIGAYLIPWLDNALDTLAVPLAGIAGTIIMVSTQAELHPVFMWSLAIIAGGGTALAIKSTTSTTRLASTATTGGIANPVVTTIETGSSVLMSIISILLPLVAILLVAAILTTIILFYRKLKRKKPRP